MDQLLDRIVRAWQSGDEKTARYFTSLYLRSYDPHLMAANVAWGKLKRHRRPPKKKIPLIARNLNAWSGTQEPAAVKLIKKNDYGDYRRVVDFGIENRALQYLVARVVEATCSRHAMQFGGKGVPQAIDKVCELMKDGYLWTVETDISNCFPSFEGENLYKFLPLPKEVIHHVIMGEQLNMVPGDSLLDICGPADGDEGDPFALDQHLAEARRGIPQGSACGSLVQEVLIAPALASLPKEAMVPSYADNMLTMARTEKDVESITLALVVALKALPVGHLTPQKRNSSQPGEPILVFGHRLNYKNGNLVIEPNPKNDWEFKNEVNRGLARLGKPAATAVKLRRAGDLEDYVTSWCASFSRCVGMQHRRDHLLAKIKTTLANG